MSEWLGFWAFTAMAQVQSLVGDCDPTRHAVQPKKKKTPKLYIYLFMGNISNTSANQH